MRPGVLQLIAIAVLFACVRSSSTRPSSTSESSTRSDEHDVPVQRSLQNATETSKDERGADFVSLKPKLAEKAISLSYQLQKLNLLKDPFKFLRLDHAGKKLQRTARYKAWVKYVAMHSKPIPAIAIKTVVDQLGTKGLVNMLNDFKRNGANEDHLNKLKSALVTHIEGEQKHNLSKEDFSADTAKKSTNTVEKSTKTAVDSRTLDETTADDAFTALKFNKAGDNSFGDHTLPESAIKTASKDYSAEGLLKMFEASAKAEASEAVLTTLKSGLMASWKDKKMSAMDVSKLLKIDQETDGPLYVKRLELWVEYVKNSSDPDFEMKLVIARYDFEARVIILGGLRKIKGTENVTKPLLDSMATLLKLNREKISADDAFTALRLEKAGKNMFSDPNFDMWVKFAAKETNIEKIPKSTIDTVSKIYGDEGLVKMFEIFAKAEASEAVLTRLKLALMASWKKKGKSAKDVFVLLKLNQKLEFKHLVNVMLLRLWVQHVEEALHLPSLQMGMVINAYDLNVRVNILGGLRQIDGTGSVVENLENSLVNLFQKRDNSFQIDEVIQVFKDLKLDDGLENFSSHPNLGLFKKYLAKFEPKNPEAIVFTVLRRFTLSRVKRSEDVENGRTLASRAV